MVAVYTLFQPVYPIILYFLNCLILYLYYFSIFAIYLLKNLLSLFFEPYYVLKIILF